MSISRRDVLGHGLLGVLSSAVLADAAEQSDKKDRAPAPLLCRMKLPNLVGRFVRGASSKATAGEQLEADAKTITTAKTPAPTRGVQGEIRSLTTGGFRAHEYHAYDSNKKWGKPRRLVADDAKSDEGEYRHTLGGTIGEAKAHDYDVTVNVIPGDVLAHFIIKFRSGK